MNQAKYQRLKQFLTSKCRGKKNARTAEQLINAGLIKESRDLRHPTPLKLMEDGVLLCSNTGKKDEDKNQDPEDKRGYFVATSWLEWQQTSGQLHSRIINESVRIKKGNELADELFGGQQQLFAG